MSDWRENIALTWHGTPRPDLEGRIRQDIAAELEDLAVPEDLCFHNIWLEDDPQGPTVLVWGEEGDASFHVEFIGEPEWIQIDPPKEPAP